MNVSDLLVLAYEIGQTKSIIVKLFAKLYFVANLQKCFSDMSRLGILDYLFDVAELLS